MTEPEAEAGPNPRIIVGFLAVIIVVQGLYAGVEILGGGLDTSHPLLTIAGMAYFVYAAMLGVFVIGVWRKLPWAWMLGVAIVVFDLALAGLQILAGDTLEQHVLGVLIDAGVLYYLFKPNIRAMFTA
jgi:hypothetical protein